jgi:8-oxo-dGTP pyrophosphatase MutT (NUDIX family)
MNFEPQKFFIGLVDFFSILMPGAMLAYVVKDWGASAFLGSATHFQLTSVEAGLIFLFASYLLGHLVFLLSAVLDEWVYDPLRGLTDWGQITRKLARSKGLSACWKRSFAASGLLFGSGADNAVMQAQRIKARALHALAGEDAINAFQWCKARLTKTLPEGLLVVQRFEADSKFFRSFFVVLGTVAALYALRQQWLAAALCALGMPPALWRYIDQRFKSTQQAYWCLLTLEAEKGEPLAVPRPDGLSHAGGVVYRRTPGQAVEFMLVEASKDRSQRVLPKGHIEPGENPRVTAVREVREETGHWVKVISWLGDARLGEDADAPFVRWFLLEVCEEPTQWPPEDRQFRWFSLEAAKQATAFPETRALLARAAANIERTK